MGWIKSAIDKVLDAIYSMLEFFLLLLPNSPIQKTELVVGDGPFREIMSFINYFVPVGTMIGIMSAYIAAVVIWYVVRWILRLGQYIS